MSDTPSELTALALNSGSSSLKFGLYRVGASRTDTLFTGVAESIGEPNSRFRMRDSQGNTLTHDTAPIRSQREAVIRIGKLFDDAKTPAPEAIGHRGASVTAVKDGKSIDTSMGLTPSGGVIMGTRSGDLDPGILVYLMRELKLDAARLEHMINHRSGLIGISATGSDMRRLHEASSENPNARLAVDMFCYSVRKQIAAMIAVLGGIDLIVFTGGIGENDGAVREAICAGLSWAGVSLGPAPSSVLVKVLPSQEDEQIARHTWTVSRAG